MVLPYLVFLSTQNRGNLKEEMRVSQNFLIISTDITPTLRNSKSGGLIPGLRSQPQHLSVVERTETLRSMGLNSHDKTEIRLFSLGRFLQIK